MELNTRKKYLYRVSSLILLLGMWQGISMSHIFPKALFPGLPEIGMGLLKELWKGNLGIQILYSIWTIVICLIISLWIAVVLLLLSRIHLFFREFIHLVSQISHPLPGIAILPLVILWFGIGKSALYFVLIHSMLWPLWIQLDAAIEEGMFLTKFASKVTVSVMHDEGIMDCNEIAKEAALSNPKMEFVWNSVVKRFEGDGHLSRVVLKNVKTEEEIPVDCDNCFEFIGYLPNSELFENQVTLTNRKYIPVNEKKETNIEGVFAIGDVTDKWLKQIATAVGDGAIAGTAAEKYIAEKEIFDTKIMQKEKNGLIYVYNAIDETSRAFLSEIEKIEEAMSDNICVNRIDVYKSNGVALKLKVENTPCVVVTKNGVITEYITSLDSEKIRLALQ